MQHAQQTKTQAEDAHAWRNPIDDGTDTLAVRLAERGHAED